MNEPKYSNGWYTSPVPLVQLREEFRWVYETIKEQAKLIEELRKQLEELEAVVATL